MGAMTTRLASVSGPTVRGWNRGLEEAPAAAITSTSRWAEQALKLATGQGARQQAAAFIACPIKLRLGLGPGDASVYCRTRHRVDGVTRDEDKACWTHPGLLKGGH